MPAITTSSSIDWVDHNGRALVVRYKNGSEYHYPDVPRFLYARLLSEAQAGTSVGRFLNQHILPHYEAKRQHQGG